MADYLPAVESALAELQRLDVVPRIWAGDHTVWKPDPAEISDRLGWLTVTHAMREQVPQLQSFARDVADAGFRHVVLLGMGGSSLGPEVLRQTFGSTAGHPQLVVLDSTAPAWVQAVTGSIDPARTLFLVSSKSGSTIEPNTLYAHFRSLVEASVGIEQAGGHFAAVTDPGTVLEKLAIETGFRRAFLNPPDIGGRYSVLSLFGLVPAALIGLDVDLLLDRADAMRDRCRTVEDNPGAWLGALMATSVQQGRDKLTLVTSPSIEGFGLWVEQLLAESTGKEDTGVVPVAGEPLLDPQAYGSDRLFVYLRLAGDDNVGTEAKLEKLQTSGHPVVRLDLDDRYDLGAEFFRWQFATAVASSVLGIHPFDQPNVQLAKDQTDSVLARYQASGALPVTEGSGDAQDLLLQARPGDYLAIMVYGFESHELAQALHSLRQKVMERHQIATTLGYGPRFLHSTGQMHKGGANAGLFLQFTTPHPKDIEIPGHPMTFGVLNDAQSLGDLQALQASGRRVVRVQLGSDEVANLTEMIDTLG